MVAAVDQWKTWPRVPGESRSIQDGKIWQTIKGPDGQKLFYGDSSENEIRLGVTFSLDWCFSFASLSFPPKFKTLLGFSAKPVITGLHTHQV
jgi:hypothetical protein